MTELRADVVAYMLNPGRRLADANGPGEDEGDPWRRKLAGALMLKARDHLLAEAAALERVSALEPIAADLVARYRAAAGRLMPERRIATDALRMLAAHLRKAKRWVYAPGGGEVEVPTELTTTAVAWQYMADAAQAWAIRKRVERTMRAHGWLE